MNHFAGESTLVPGALRAYRTWALRDGELAAVAHRTTWDATLTAGCSVARAEEDLLLRRRGDYYPRARTLSDHPAPVQSCSCGIYAWYRPGDTHMVTGAVFGAIEVSGRCILGDNGVRAEHARILALTPATPMDARSLRAWCAVRGVAFFDKVTDLVAAFPPDDLTALDIHPSVTTTNPLHDPLAAPSWVELAQQIPAPPKRPWTRLDTLTGAFAAWCTTFAVVCGLWRNWVGLGIHAALAAWNLGWVVRALRARRRGLCTWAVVCFDGDGRRIGLPVYERNAHDARRLARLCNETNASLRGGMGGGLLWMAREITS